MPAWKEAGPESFSAGRDVLAGLARIRVFRWRRKFALTSCGAVSRLGGGACFPTRRKSDLTAKGACLYIVKLATAQEVHC